MAGVLAASVACAPEPAGPASGMLPRDDGAAIAWWAVGRGEPVLVVHGGPGLDHRYLRPGLDVLSGDHRLIYFDQRGVGGSRARYDTTSISLERFVSDLDVLRELHGRGPVVVLGHSFGALIALAYARGHPDAVRGVVLLSPVEPGARFRAEAGRRTTERRTPEDAEALAALMASAEFQAREPAAMERMNRLAYRATVADPSVLERLDLGLDSVTARHGFEVGSLLGASMGGLDWWDDLPALDVPVLVVHGREDPTPLAMSEALVAALPRGRLEVVPAGHFPWLEAPDALARAVSDFTASLR